MATAYTSGDWHVKAGEEDAFVKDWAAFASWGQEAEGSGTFRLVRDTANPSHYLSFAPWESLEAQQAWRELADFGERLERVRGHCDRAESSTYDVVTEIG